MNALATCRRFALGLLAAAACCLPAVGSPPEELGRVLCVGDSITHGKSSGSWRWELFKIFVDNGIRLQEVGVQSGNYNGRGGVAPGTRYRGETFANRHAAQYSERAAEVAGRLTEPSRMGGTGIRHWLRLDGSSDGMWQLAEDEMPDTFFLAIGTNDFVAEHSAVAGGVAAGLREVQEQLIGRRRSSKSWNGKGDMDAILVAMREANPQARIVVIGIPTFSDAVGAWCHKAVTPADYEALQSYHKNLRHWGRSQNVLVVDVNPGFRDVTREGAAVASMLVDQMHPNAQGNLIYAGNLARALGYAGRTAGLERRHASDFPTLPSAQVGTTGARAGKNGAFSLTAGGQLVFNGSHAVKGATVECRFTRKGYGNGAKGGWSEDEPLQVHLSVAGHRSELSVMESGICWQGRLLYSADMSKVTEPVRLAYVSGSLREGIAGGFYVWLGDMLIGEALRGTQVQEAGLNLLAGATPVMLTHLVYDPSHAWAPSTHRLDASAP